MFGGDGCEIRRADLAMGDGLAGAADDDRLLLQVFRAFKRSDYDRPAAVTDDAAIEKVKRVCDHAASEYVFAGDRIAHLCVGIEGGMVPG